MTSPRNRPVAVDASVAVALLVAPHRAHAVLTAWWSGRAVATRDARARTT